MFPSSAPHGLTPGRDYPSPNNASYQYFGILPKEVIARIFLRLPIESALHSAITSRVCTSFAGISVPHRFAASVYAGANLRQAGLSPAECVARFDKTLADLARHADSIEDSHKLTILNRLVEQMDMVPVEQQAKVWCQLLDARFCLAKAAQPDYVLNCLRNPVTSNDLFQPEEIFDCFRAVISSIDEAPVDVAKRLFREIYDVPRQMPAGMQLEAFTELLNVCEKLDDTLRSMSRIETIDSIFLLEVSNQSKAVDIVLQLLPRLPADEACPVLRSLFQPWREASDRLTTRCLDAGILLFNRSSGSGKHAVLHELFVGAEKLPQLLRDRYDPSLFACYLSLPVEQQD